MSVIASIRKQVQKRALGSQFEMSERDKKIANMEVPDLLNEAKEFYASRDWEFKHAFCSSKNTRYLANCPKGHRQCISWVRVEKFGHRACVECKTLHRMFEECGLLEEDESFFIDFINENLDRGIFKPEEVIGGDIDNDLPPLLREVVEDVMRPEPEGDELEEEE
jgi:hypothetical protein